MYLEIKITELIFGDNIMMTGNRSILALKLMILSMRVRGKIWLCTIAFKQVTEES